MRARRAALVVVALRTVQGHRTGERPLSSGARPCCEVPAAASNIDGLSSGSHASAPLRSLSMVRRRSTHSYEEHARCRAGCSRSVPYTRPLHRRETSLIRRKTVL